FSVAPEYFVAQMKNQLSPAFENIPRLSDNRRGLQLLIELGETDHQVGDNVERDMVGRQRPVETGRLRAEIDPEIPSRRAALRTAFAAGAKEQHAERKGWPKAQTFVL